MNDSRLKRRWRGVRGLDGELTERDSQHKIEREKGKKPTTDSGARLKKRWVGVRGLDGSWGQSGFTLDVDAERVDRTHVSYLCPFCARTHRHGSGGDIRNRVEDRSTHCHRRRPHNVRIQITDQTEREAPPTPD